MEILKLINKIFKTNFVEILETDIYRYVEKELCNISDECGKQYVSTSGGHYIFCYEGWSGNCFPNSIKFDENGDSDSAINYAAQQTKNEVIPEWKKIFRELEFIEDLSGYYDGGLYGTSYATFRIPSKLLKRGK